MQVHRDIMDGRFRAAPFAGASAPGWVSRRAPGSTDGATLEGPCFVDEGAVVKTGARIGPYAVIGRQVPRRGGRAWSTAPSSGRTRGSAASAIVRGSILGRNCHIGRNAVIDGPAACSATRRSSPTTASFDGPRCRSGGPRASRRP